MPSETAYQNYCHECDEDDIRELIEMYVDAAKRSEDAGFDYVEVIGSDSSLPTQFLQPMYNKRTDRWGGSFENRARFWLETMAAIKRAVGDRVAVGTRIAIDNLLGPAGLELEEGLRFRGVWSRARACAICGTSRFRTSWSGATMPAPRASSMPAIRPGPRRPSRR